MAKQYYEIVISGGQDKSKLFDMYVQHLETRFDRCVFEGASDKSVWYNGKITIPYEWYSWVKTDLNYFYKVLSAKEGFSNVEYHNNKCRPFVTFEYGNERYTANIISY